MGINIETQYISINRACVSASQEAFDILSIIHRCGSNVWTFLSGALISDLLFLFVPRVVYSLVLIFGFPGFMCLFFSQLDYR